MLSKRDNLMLEAEGCHRKKEKKSIKKENKLKKERSTKAHKTEGLYAKYDSV